MFFVTHTEENTMASLSLFPRLSLTRRIAVAAMTLPLLAAAVAPALVPVRAAAETAIMPERNPPGDIPDTQVFVTYSSDAGYSLKVPEGWARSGDAKAVTFVDKFDGLSVTTTSEASAPTLDWAKSTYLPQMQQSGRAVKVASVTQVKLPAGDAIRISYQRNSEPNQVTAKQIRLESDRYLFWNNGILAALDLWAPAGADNVDQWKLMSESLRWQ